MRIWSCSRCGKPYLTEKMKKCNGRSSQSYSDCNGTRKNHIIGAITDCPRCNGSGWFFC